MQYPLAKSTGHLCGYSIPDGYVVEREQGGRGYNVAKIVLLRYPLRPPPPRPSVSDGVVA